MAAKPVVEVFAEHQWKLGPMVFHVAETERLADAEFRQVIVPGRRVVLSAGIAGRGHRSIGLPCSLNVLVAVLIALGAVLVGLLGMVLRRKSNTSFRRHHQGEGGASPAQGLDCE